MNHSLAILFFVKFVEVLDGRVGVVIARDAESHF